MIRIMLPALLALTNLGFWIYPGSMPIIGIALIIWSFTTIFFTAYILETLTQKEASLYQQLLPSRILGAMQNQKSKSDTRKISRLFEPVTLSLIGLMLLYALWSSYTLVTQDIPILAELRPKIEAILGSNYTSINQMRDPYGHSYIALTGKHLTAALAVWIAAGTAIISHKSKVPLIALGLILITNIALTIYDHAFIETLLLNATAFITYGWHLIKPRAKRYRPRQP